MLWQHPTPQSTPMWKFLEHVNGKYKLCLKDYRELHEWSIEHIADHWDTIAEYVGIRTGKTATKVSTTPRGVCPDTIG